MLDSVNLFEEKELIGPEKNALHIAMDSWKKNNIYLYWLAKITITKMTHWLD